MSKHDSNYGGQIVRSVLIPNTNQSCDTITAENVPEVIEKMLKEPPKDIRKRSFIKEIKYNKSIRFKFVLSILVSLAFSILGWAVSQIGPAFPDLVDITNTDLKRGSGFMTSYFTGRLVGSGLGGVLYSKMNTYLMFVISLVVNGAAIAAIPWCSLYELMITTHALHGLSGGVLNVAVTSTAMAIWGPTTRGHSYVQIMYVFYAVSSTLAPIATAPFLSETENDNVLRNISDITTVSTGSLTTGQCCVGNKSYYNNTLARSSETAPLSESKLYVAYSISAGMAFLIAIPFIVLYLTRQSEATRISKTDGNKFLGNLPRVVNYLQFVNVGVFAAMYSASDLLFLAYLTIFCVQHLHWTKASSAMLTSVVVFATLVSRFIGIFLVRVMKSYTILLLSITLYTIGFVCMAVSAHLYADIGIWISTCIIGLPSGVLWPSMLSWMNSYLIPVSGKVSSYLLVLAYLGALLCPSVLGYLMQEVSLLWFCYICIILSAVNIINVMLMVLYTIYSKRMLTLSKL